MIIAKLPLVVITSINRVIRTAPDHLYGKKERSNGEQAANEGGEEKEKKG